MDANIAKMTFVGAIAIGVVFVCASLFQDFGREYEETIKPQESQVERETPAQCMERTDRQRANLEKWMNELSDKQWALSHGKAQTKNQAHRDYLEKFYARKMEGLENQYETASHETCNGGM